MGYQVFTATHNGEGSTLPSFERAFISFSYGGKNIEDFDLISVTTSDRIERDISAAYKDTTTEKDGLNGQLFWGSAYNALELHFFLATDGISARKLNEFTEFFKPGYERELILTEHPNRAIKARVASVPRYTLMPFENIQIIDGIEIATTEYRGEMEVSFICDDPFWYSIDSVIKSEAYTKQDYNVALEDGVPLFSRIESEENIFLGDNKLFSDSSIIDNEGVDLEAEAGYPLYYCGSAKAIPTLYFERTIEYENYKSTGFESSYFSINNNKLFYKNPAVLAAINDVIDIVGSYSVGSSVIDIRNKLRDNIHHYKIRGIANGVITDLADEPTYVNTTTSEIELGFYDEFCDRFYNYYPTSLNVIINYTTGEASVTYTVDEETITEDASDMLISNTYYIEGADYYDSNFEITPETCHTLISSADVSSFKITYNYLYN